MSLELELSNTIVDWTFQPHFILLGSFLMLGDILVFPKARFNITLEIIITLEMYTIEYTI
jgi:hypothetical protein